MKKVIMSLFVLSALATPAFAQKSMKHSAKNCPAKTCTDHSHDEAYSAAKGGSVAGVEWADEEATARRGKRNCPAATCTDHSYDQAYNAGWTVPAQAATGTSAASRPARLPREINVSNATPTSTWTAPTPARSDMRGDAYSMNNYTFYGRYGTAPNPYNGDDAPSYDGAAKNAYRNLRANNESAPLPPNNGGQ